MRAAGAFVLGLVLLGGSAASARNGEEEWGALSTTALAITGNIVLSPTRMQTAGAIFPLKVAADLPRFRASEGIVGARVLQITRPMNPVLLNGNTLCGRTRPRWIAVWRADSGKTCGWRSMTAPRVRRVRRVPAPSSPMCGS